MKKISTLILFLAIINSVFSQENVNKIVYDEIAEENIILEYCNKNGLTSEPFDAWFNKEYDSYIVDSVTLDQINPNLLSELEITVVLGTWCGDSKREVPRFIKITEYLGFEEGQFFMIGVDKNKKANRIPIIRMEVEFVPTFILYIDGEEIGRIIESPIETLEKDILNIISSI